MTSNSNSSDGDSKEAMETCGGVVSLNAGEKRKAETINLEDSGESEEGSESEEEKIEDRFKWGYDSYDDREYHSSDQSEYSSDKELEKQWRYYCRHVTETKGFFKSSDKFPRSRIGGFGSAKDLDAPDGGSEGNMRQFCTKLTSVCIKKYNEENKKNIKLEEILTVNYRIAWWSKYYITFSARESESSNAAPLMEYQAKATWCITRSDEFIYPILCRLSPTNNL